MKPAAFDAFRKDLASSLTKTLGLNGWRVVESERKENSLAGKFQDRLAQAGFVTIAIETYIGGNTKRRERKRNSNITSTKAATPCRQKS